MKSRKRRSPRRKPVRASGAQRHPSSPNSSVRRRYYVGGTMM